MFRVQIVLTTSAAMNVSFCTITESIHYYVLKFRLESFVQRQEIWQVRFNNLFVNKIKHNEFPGHVSTHRI